MATRSGLPLVPRLAVSIPKFTLACLGGGQRYLLVGNDGQRGRALRIDCQPLQLVRRELRLFVNRVDGAGRHAGSAVHALYVVDIQHLRGAVKTGDRAGSDTVGESATLALVGDDVRHGNSMNPAGPVESVPLPVAPRSTGRQDP